ncbi:MAG: winged helix-turn-helix domain-containing protein [Actinomycetes bacterium]
METLSRAEARRAALAAQRFTGRGRTTASVVPAKRRLLGLVDHLGLLQIDSVSALVRSHYLPAYSRLGSYRRDHLDQLAWRDGKLFEAWAHEASLLPVRFEPLLRWRQSLVLAESQMPGKSFHRATQLPQLIAAVLKEIRERGPLAASELRHLEENPKQPGSWWNWSSVKAVLEFLFATGQVHVAERRAFERRYDVPERVLPPEIVATPTPDEGSARRALLLHAAHALGVATVTDLADYFRMKNAVAAARTSELVEEGALVEVGVQGWDAPAYIVPGFQIPRRVRTRALLSPFDPIVWCRPRALRMYDFHYRIEIYTPEPKRIYGYYVLPFLLGDRIVGRVDLRADRAAGVLRVPAGFAEERVDPVEITPHLADELRLLAHWLDLDHIEVGDRGDLTKPLAALLGS